MNKFLEKITNEFRGGKMTPLLFKKILRYAGRSASKFAGNLIPMSYIIKGLSVKPSTLNLSTINTCNARCIFCAYQYLTAPRGIMSDKVFKKAVNDFVDIGGGNIGFTPTVGDALLDPEIIERIKYCRSFSNIKNIGFYTNGIFLSNIDLKRFLTSGINSISISMGGFDRKSYEKVYGVDRFNEVYKGIVNSYKVNRDLGKPVKISISLRTYKSINEVMKEPAYKEINRLVDSIDYQYNFDSWNGMIRQSDLLGFMKLRELEQKSEPCSILYAGLSVFWNGDVTVCGCRDLNGDSELVLGNIMKSSLIDLWRGEKLKKIRQGFLEGEIPDICKNCSHYESVKNLKTFHFRREARKNLKLYKKY